MAPAVSAIVVTYRTGPRLRECLYGLASDPAAREIIIVDNGNPPEMRGWLEGFAAARDHVRLVDAGGNVGFAAGCNLGARNASGSHLLFVNPDAVARRGALERMTETSQSLAEPWIIGGRIFDIDGRECRGPRRRELTLWRALTSFTGINTWTLENTPAPDTATSMPVISGAFFMMSREGFDRLDGFDEGYFLHVEDVDLCRRARGAGGDVIYEPRAGALHYGSTSDAPSQVVQAHKARSLARYFRKFASGPLDRLAVALVVPLLSLAIRMRR